MVDDSAVTRVDGSLTLGTQTTESDFADAMKVLETAMTAVAETQNDDGVEQVTDHAGQLSQEAAESKQDSAQVEVEVVVASASEPQADHKRLNPNRSNPFGRGVSAQRSNPFDGDNAENADEEAVRSLNSPEN